MSTCKICNANTQPLFTAKVLNKYDVQYVQCNNCKFIQTEQTYWLNEAYQSAINNNDTGIIMRNERFRAIVTVLISFIFGKNEKYLDYAGGYGIFTRMMRDVGFDYYWVDEYAKNLVSIGFEHKTNTTYKAITAFEVFEHLDNPEEKLKDMLTYTDNIIFSTELVPDQTPDKDWWYYAFTHGQHIAFYHKNSLLHLAQKNGLHLSSNGSNFHVLSKKPLNPLLFKLLYKGSKFGLFWFSKLGLQTKTFSDHKLMS